MRVYLLGLPGSGKTTLAKKLAAQHDLKHIELDEYFHYWQDKKYSRRYFEDFQAELLIQLQQSDNWIIEGVNPIVEISHLADEISYLHTPSHQCVIRQWRRFATDPNQRDKARFNLFTNLGLTCLTIGITLNIWGVKVYASKPKIKLKTFLKTQTIAPNTF